MCTKTTTDLVFAQKFNPMSGKLEWEAQDENFDYHQEIARSAYADMLHDTERNQMYEAGLKWAIQKLRREGKPVRVLDIGTGTGLLAMFACRLGADQVTACEAFRPVATCARQIIKDNGFSERIRLIPKRSTELKVGPGCDLEQRATILVTEVFDTELIGEGAIFTFNHAHEHLLEKYCLVIPSRAKVYCQLVESSQLRNCHRPERIKIPEHDDILPPSETFLCHGSAAVFDIQMSQLSMNSLTFLTKPFQICSFDFGGKDGKIPSDDSFHVVVNLQKSGQCDAILFWWDIDMDGDGQLVLSCAPWWNHPQGRAQAWRDHWMQAVYYPLNSLTTAKGDDLVVSCFHDEYSFWFDVQQSGNSIPETLVEKRPVCTCGFHMVCNPQRISTINDTQLNAKYCEVLKKIITSDSVCVVIGSGCSMLPFVAARFGAKKVYVIDTSQLSSQILRRFIETNNMQSQITILSKACEELTDEDLENQTINVVLSEPYILSNYLPWHDICLWYSIKSLKRFLSESCQIVPYKCQIWAIGVQFSHLWKIRAPLGEIEGLNMKSFDQLIQGSISVADPPVEPFSLWEYEGIALTEPILLLDFKLNQPIDDDLVIESIGKVDFKSLGSCNGIAIWSEWFLDKTTIINRGLTKPAQCGENLSWDFNSKQGVYFVSPKEVNLTDSLVYSMRFVPTTFSYQLQFDIETIIKN